MKLTGGTFFLSLLVVVYSVHRGRMVCSLKGKMKPRAVSFLRETHIPLPCILQCFLHSSCVSVLFDAKEYICSDLSKTPGAAALRLDTTLSTLQCRVNTMKYGMRCLEDSECEQIAGTRCLSGTCLCDPTLRYSPSMRRCTKCQTDGETFSHYPRRKINMVSETTHRVTNITLCEKVCLQANEFTCRLVNYDWEERYSKRLCYLFQLTYVDVPPRARTRKKYWSILLRDCV